MVILSLQEIEWIRNFGISAFARKASIPKSTLSRSLKRETCTSGTYAKIYREIPYFNYLEKTSRATTIKLQQDPEMRKVFLELQDPLQIRKRIFNRMVDVGLNPTLVNSNSTICETQILNQLKVEAIPNTNDVDVSFGINAGLTVFSIPAISTFLLEGGAITLEQLSFLAGGLKTSVSSIFDFKKDVLKEFRGAFESNMKDTSRYELWKEFKVFLNIDRA